MSTTDGLVIPVSTPGADKAAEDLGRVAAATAQVGHGATEMGASVARGGNTSAQALTAIGASAARSESHLADLKATGNQALGELGEKGAEFARSLGGAGGAVAELGVKILAAAGPYGAMAAAGVGAIGMIVGAINEHQAALDLDKARSEALASSTAHLGGAYSSVALAIANAKTATEARSAAGAAELVILQQQVTLMQRGFSGGQADAQTAAISRLVDAQRLDTAAKQASARALIEHALASGNAEEQQRILGVTFRHSTDATVEARNQMLATTVASARAAAATVEERTRLNEAAVARRRAAQEEARHTETREEAAAASRELREAEAAALVTYGNLNRAVASNARLQRDAAAASAELRNASVILTDAQKEEETTLNRLTAAKEARAASQAASAGPSAQEQRAAVEALRVAREANENVGLAIPVTEQQAQALRALAFATNEVALAERALRTGSTTVAERTALAQALTGQTTAQQALTAIGEAESVAARARVAAVDAETNARERSIHLLEREAGVRQQAARAAFVAERAAISVSLKNAEGAREGERAASIAKLQSDRMDSLKSSAEGLAGGFVSAGIAAAIAGEAIGPAMQKALSASLSSLAQQAAVKSLFELAEGFAALGSVVLAPTAPAHFTSAAIFAGVAVAAGAGAAATAPSTPAASSGGGSPAPAAGGMGTMNTGTSGGGSNNTTINYYAPTFGGREGGIGEVGQQIDRYRRDNTALRRTRP